MTTPLRLDLGCGPRPKAGFMGIDLCEAPGVVPFDLASGMPWPFEDESVDALYSSHLIEHLPAGKIAVHGGTVGSIYWLGQRDALCWFMDQAWRVARLGAPFEIRWPALLDDRTKQICLTAFEDPTHYRFIPASTFVMYFNRQGRKVRGVEQYPIVCNWRVEYVHQNEYRNGQELVLVENEARLIKEA